MQRHAYSVLSFLVNAAAAAALLMHMHAENLARCKSGGAHTFFCAHKLLLQQPGQSFKMW